MATIDTSGIDALYPIAGVDNDSQGFRDNFVFAFIGATLVVFIATKTDIAVLLGYLFYYFFMGRILNRPKYVTDLGKLIVFPIPSALGAFTGYKLSYFLIQLLS